MAKLPHDLDLFFARTEGAIEVSLSDLFPMPPLPDKISKARQNMNLAYEGLKNKRGPLTVKSRGDGKTYDIMKGSSTYEVAKENSWPSILVEPE
ncbi:MAG: hypothetical protein DHS20C02_16210 [Micavibrio sp.]|nr:MAG: hypothetical protein DHS20C02_16210 [Micavibrio sp.]